MRNIKVLFLVFVFLPIQSAYTSSRNSESHQAITQKTEIEKQLLSLGYSNNEIKLFFYQFKETLSKKGWNKEIFDDKDWLTYFSAKKYSIKDKNGSIRFIVLELNMKATWEYEYLFFFRNKTGVWKYNKIIDASTKYSESDLIHINFSGHDFVSLHNTDGGTGIYNSYYFLYLIGENEIKKVMEYPSEGHRSTWGLNYDVEYEANPLTIIKDSKKPFLELKIDVTYSAGKCEVMEPVKPSFELFSKKYKYYYFWDEHEKKLKIDYSKTNSKQDPYKTILIDNSDEEFMATFYDDLEKMAKDGSVSVKKWLDCFLKSCKPENSEQKMKMQELQKTLKNSSEL